MAGPIGFSFEPGADAGQMRDHMMAAGGPGGSVRGNSSPQQAVRILSLRVPAVLPPNAPVSRELLNNHVNGGPAGSGLSSVVRAMMEAFKPTAPTAGPQFPTPQSPRSVASTQPPVPRVPDQVFQSQPSQPQTPAAQGPQFIGNIDTPSMQNAPPLDMGVDYGDYGNMNGWQALTFDDTEQRQRYLELLSRMYQQSLQTPQRQNAPTRTGVGASNPPITGGGTNA